MVFVVGVVNVVVSLTSKTVGEVVFVLVTRLFTCVLVLVTVVLVDSVVVVEDVCVLVKLVTDNMAVNVAVVWTVVVVVVDVVSVIEVKLIVWVRVELVATKLKEPTVVVVLSLIVRVAWKGSHTTKCMLLSHNAL